MARIMNYSHISWRCLYIFGRDKLGLIISEITQSALTNPTYSKWRIENVIVKGWIINSLNPDLLGILLDFLQIKVFRMSLPQPTSIKEIMSRYII
jgi:hypothetical protein